MMANGRETPHPMTTPSPVRGSPTESPYLFASVALAARIDRAEVHLTESVVRAVMASMPESRAFVASVGGGVATYAGPSSPMTKMIGVGFEGATLPRFRRRGIQAALLRRRLADGARASCDVVVMTTQPGSTSQANGQRRGFGLLYARALLVKDPVA